MGHQPRDLSFEIERRGDRLAQHERGIERAGELCRLGQRRQHFCRGDLDGDEDASDAAHGWRGGVRCLPAQAGVFRFGPQQFPYSFRAALLEWFV